MPSETRDGHNEVPEIGRRPGLECVRFLPAGCARAKIEGGQAAPAEKNSLTTGCERRHEALCVSRRPMSEPTPDRDQADRSEIARCANRSECREHPRTAGSRSSPRAARSFPGPPVPPATAHSLPNCSQPDRVPDYGEAARME